MQISDYNILTETLSQTEQTIFEFWLKFMRAELNHLETVYISIKNNFFFRLTFMYTSDVTEGALMFQF